MEQHQANAGFVRDTITSATDDSVRQRLTLAHERIDQLRPENQQLRGELRADRLATSQNGGAGIGEDNWGRMT